MAELGKIHSSPLITAIMKQIPNLTLTGTHVRLEPLERYIATAIAWREAGSAVPFAIVRVDRAHRRNEWPDVRRRLNQLMA